MARQANLLIAAQGFRLSHIVSRDTKLSLAFTTLVLKAISNATMQDLEESAKLLGVKKTDRAWELLIQFMAEQGLTEAPVASN